MRVRVRFRFNTETGQVEVFQVDDVGGHRSIDHDAEHEEIAHQIGSLLERRVTVEEVLDPSTVTEHLAQQQDDELDLMGGSRQQLENTE